MSELTHRYVIFSSAGNDSIALIQWMTEHGHTAYVVYSNTGWARPGWGARVQKMFAWARLHGHTPIEIGSEGMESLVRRKKAWPRNQLQFCTSELKIKPAMAWLEEIDPDGELECCVGIRRSESARRSRWPEHTEDSDKHGGRDLWAPLVRHLDADRDALLQRAGWETLPHRSMECYPCINANRGDFLLLDEARITHIAKLEQSMGVSVSTGKPKTMFRPYRHMGAIGIREVVRWAKSSRGKFVPEYYPVVLEALFDCMEKEDRGGFYVLVAAASPRFIKYARKQFISAQERCAEEDRALWDSCTAALHEAMEKAGTLSIALEDVQGPGEVCDAGMCGL